MTPAGDAAALARIGAADLRRRRRGEQGPRLRACVQLLGDDGVWRRPGPTGNAVGNLLLHLRGNTTQWILATFDDVADRRDRDAEFAARDGATGSELLDGLANCWRRACDVVDGLTVEDLLRERTIQARYRETGLAAVLHVLEHCAGHAAQVYAWTKQATGRDLAFYDL
ncbi:MAG: DinB family protein [Planctomycetota bacterium]